MLFKICAAQIQPYLRTCLPDSLSHLATYPPTLPTQPAYSLSLLPYVPVLLPSDPTHLA